MTIRITGMNSGLDTDAIIQELVSAKSYKKTQLEKAQKKLEWKQEAWKNLNTKVYSFYTSTLSDLRFESSFEKKKTTSSNPNAVSVATSDNAPYSTQTIQVNKLAKAGYMTGAQLSGGTGNYTGSTTLSELGITADTGFEVTTAGTTTTINLTADTTLKDVVSQLSSAGLNANFDEKNQRLYISSKETGAEADFTFSGDSTALGALGLSEASGAKKIDGQDAEIVLNNVPYTSKNNVFEINGLTITAQEVTTSDVTLTTTSDTSGIYDMIKKFIKNYNSLINEMDKLYNADSSKGYEPLTDDEKDAMSDTEVEKWETKIKDSILRKDSTLSSVASAMKEIMSAGVTMRDGTQMYLFDFGIDTLGYFNAPENERNAYHIDGDADDTSTSTNEKKLEAMIASDPEKVTEFFATLAKNLYGTLTEKMSSITNMRSAFTVYNDKQMKEEYASYTEKIAAQQKKIDAFMDKYYAKFSAMETALASLDSKSNAVSQLLGM